MELPRDVWVRDGLAGQPGRRAQESWPASFARGLRFRPPPLRLCQPRAGRQKDRTCSPRHPQTHRAAHRGTRHDPASTRSDPGTRLARRALSTRFARWTGQRWVTGKAAARPRL